jgi:hypothetical protein
MAVCAFDALCENKIRVDGFAPTFTFSPCICQNVDANIFFSIDFAVPLKMRYKW